MRLVGGAFNRARILMVIAGLSLPIHLFLLHVISTRPGICWVFAPPFDKSIHQESFFLLHAALNRVRIIFLPPGKLSYSKAPSTDPGSYWLLLPLIFHPPGSLSYSFMASSTGPGLCLVMLASLWLFHPPWIITFFTRAL